MRAAEGRLPNFAELDRRAEAESSARIGWPAPDDPAEAIDHAEYDLAVLARFLNSEPGQSQGTARYLLTTNSYLGRALRTRWQKVEPAMEFGGRPRQTIGGISDGNCQARTWYAQLLADRAPKLCEPVRTSFSFRPFTGLHHAKFLRRSMSSILFSGDLSFTRSNSNYSSDWRQPIYCPSAGRI